MKSTLRSSKERRKTQKYKYKSTNLNKEDRTPNIVSIHIVNLDKDADRWRIMKKKINKIEPLPVRWPAIYGKNLVRTDMHKLGVGFAMIHSGKGSYDRQHKDLRNLGTVGCFLSHRNLLNHLSFTSVPDSAGHLILEDDVNIPQNFLKSGCEWFQKRKEIPDDWDIIYLGINTPIGINISPSVKKLTHAIQDQGNWGTHAYIVKHSSLKSKILPWLEYMIDAIDLQLNIKYDDWNVYAFDPAILKLGLAAKKSTIQTM